MRKFTFLLLLSLLWSSCKNEKTPDTIPEEPKLEKLAAELQCTSLSTDDTMPKFQISLNLSGKNHILDTITMCASIAEADYARYDIPSEAIDAGGGYFAGGGDYFYLLQDGNACLVMQGWQDEMQEDEGFHYEQVRRFVVSQ